MENIEEILLNTNTREITKDFLKGILRDNRVQFVERDTKATLIGLVVNNLNCLCHLITLFTERAADVDQQGLRSIFHEETRDARRIEDRTERRLHYQSCYIYFYLKSSNDVCKKKRRKKIFPCCEQP